MLIKFFVSGPLPDLNKVINAAKSHWTQYRDPKKAATEKVALMAKSAAKKQGVKIPLQRIRLKLLWVEKNRKKDPDNISFAKKYILDGLVLAGVIKNDGWKQVDGWDELFGIGQHPGVFVEVMEVNNE